MSHVPPFSDRLSQSEIARHLIWRLLTSESPSLRLSASVAVFTAEPQTSQGKTRDLPTYTRRIYSRTFRTSIGLRRFLPSHPVLLPRMRFLFVRSVVCLKLPSDSTSRWTPLPSASCSPCRASSGLSPPSHPQATTASGTASVMTLRAMPGAHRVGGGVTPAVLPHHRTYGSVYGGSCDTLESTHCIHYRHQPPSIKEHLRHGLVHV